MISLVRISENKLIEPDGNRVRYTVYIRSSLCPSINLDMTAHTECLQLVYVEYLSLSTRYIHSFISDVYFNLKLYFLVFLVKSPTRMTTILGQVTLDTNIMWEGNCRESPVKIRDPIKLLWCGINMKLYMKCLKAWYSCHLYLAPFKLNILTVRETFQVPKNTEIHNTCAF